jgi:glutamine synthetase type III
MKAEDLIAEVAKRHGVVLTVADPAIILATVLELHLEQATKEIGAMLQTGADQTAAATVAQEEAAKGVAQVVITRSAEWVAKQIQSTMERALSELRETLAAQELRLRSSSQHALWAAVISCSAALVVTCGLIWFLGA